jgi:hypothetical protein
LLHWVVAFGFFLFFSFSHTVYLVHSYYSRLSCNNAKGGGVWGKGGFQIFLWGRGNVVRGSVCRLVAGKFLLGSNLGVFSFSLFPSSLIIWTLHLSIVPFFLFFHPSSFNFSFLFSPCL